MRPSTRHLVMSLAASSLLGVMCVFAQDRPRATFERARLLDESNQNLKEAIKLYTQVVADSKNNRALAATALHHIALLHSRTGQTNDAMRTFRTLVTQYPDQSELVTRAKTRLAELAARVKPTREFELTREGPAEETGTLAGFRAPVNYLFTRAAIDEVRRRLYVFAGRLRLPAKNAQSRRALRRGLRQVYEPSKLFVIDTETNSIVKSLLFPTHIGDVVFNPANGKLYASATADGHVKVIDPRTLVETAKISLAGFPGFIGLNPETNRIYVACQGFAGNDKLFVIDGRTNAVSGPIDLDGVAGGSVMVNTVTNRVYVSSGEPQKTRVFDGDSNAVTEDLPALHIRAIDTTNNHIYAEVTPSPGVSDGVRILDGNSHRTLAAVVGGQGTVSDVALNQRSELAYVTLIEQGQLVVIDAASFSELSRRSAFSPRMVALDSATGRVFLTSDVGLGGPTLLSALDTGSLATGVSEEFFDDFESDTLAADWKVLEHNGRYSLREAPGHLRFRVVERISSGKDLLLARQFRGESWMLEFKASFFMGTSGGTRGFALRIVFGVPGTVARLLPVGSISITRDRWDWNGCCTGVTRVFFSRRCLPEIIFDTEPNQDDSYVWRVTRSGRTFTVKCSDNGITFEKVGTYTFGPEIDGMVQQVSITGGSHANHDAYADYDYVRLTKTPSDQAPGRKR